MQKVIWRPLSVGQVIDRGFQLYRTYFGKIMIIMLMTYGPFYLLGEFVKGKASQEGVGSLFGSMSDSTQLQDWLANFNLQNAAAYAGWHGIVYFAVLLPIAVLFLFPLASGAVVSLVHHVVKGEEVPPTLTLVRASLRRAWKLAGSTLLFSLMFIGVYGAAFLGLVGLIHAISVSGSRAGAVAIVLFLLLFLFIITISIVLVWLAIRWGYYLPLVALGEESIGFRRSWRLTKRNFWRMLLMWLIVSTVLYMITFMFQLMIMALLSGTVIGMLLQAIVGMLVLPIYLLPYTVSFFDLRARNEGYGLEELIRRTVAVPVAEPEPAAQEWQPRHE